MKVKLELDLQDGRGKRTMTTNMFVVCEWEKLENRKVSDGKGIGYSDIACWAYHLCKLAGELEQGRLKLHTTGGVCLRKSKSKCWQETQDSQPGHVDES